MDQEVDGRTRQEAQTIDRILELAYGRSRLTLELPGSLDVTSLRPMATQAVGRGDAVRKALSAPLNSPALTELATQARSALVVIPDKTREAGVREYLPPVLDALEEGGLQSRRLKIVTANGAHPALDSGELVELVGGDVVDRYEVLQHDSRDSSGVVVLGTTSRGTPVAVNRLCTEVDLIVLTGSVGFHYFAGFGGGRKALFPGLAAYDSIAANHRLTLGPGEGLDPRCQTGRLDGNPVHEDIMEAFAMFPSPFVLNTVMIPGGGVLEAFAGAHDQVFAAACGAARRAFAVKIAQKADLVVASCGGYPWDINLLQIHKALRNSASATRDGGGLVLVGEAAQGIGSSTLEEGLRCGSWREADHGVRRSYVLNGHTAVALLQQTERVSLHMVSALGTHPSARGWATHHGDAQAALEAALAELRVDRPFVYHMPLAGVTVPVD